MTGSSEVIQGDSLQELKQFPEGHFDSIVTDPPYELGFMGKKWDSAGIAYDPNLWGECFRVLKPNGYLLAFGGTRTYHRMTCAVEDAGFEIRDSLHWIYGSGFPKGKACLKPAHEPIVMARKPGESSPPLPGLSACRVGSEVRINPPGSTNPRTSMGDGWRKDAEPTVAEGRWPPNILFTHSAACEVECVPDCPVYQLDKQSGNLPGGGSLTGSEPSGAAQDVYGERGRVSWTSHGDEGGASRFYPCFRYNPKAPPSERDKVDEVAHTTVKPIELMSWLVRLVTPEGGIVLDPFAGSGTTGKACSNSGFKYVLIERDADYIKLIRQKLVQPTLFEDWDDD